MLLTVLAQVGSDKGPGTTQIIMLGAAVILDTQKFFTTIAAQLAGKIISLRYYISKAISANSQIVRERLGNQRKYLILQRWMPYLMHILSHCTNYLTQFILPGRHRAFPPEIN